MELEIVEAGTAGDSVAGVCVAPTLYWGCCIIHFWDWASGACGSSCWWG